LTTPGGERQASAAQAGGPPAELAAGRVGRPHGLDGSFYVTRPRPRLLGLGVELGVGGERREIVRRVGTDQRPIVRLAGIVDRAGAEGIRGTELTVLQDDAPALADGEWWSHELEGCVVRDGERLLGTVLRLLELPSCEVLEVGPVDGGPPLLVPMVKDAIRRVEVAERRIDVDTDFLGLTGEAPSDAEPPTPPATDERP
jgi:16S rRNA processing protein RimM